MAMPDAILCYSSQAVAHDRTRQEEDTLMDGLRAVAQALIASGKLDAGVPPLLSSNPGSSNA
ncbi:hypothetical protein [Vineibacter terrae]|uniref:hypothetical protein n=1 Tax=Vineibacter terrae TaxID=2586908 RepID=UPI002E358054|nr:hypothetical protein [Vineibacter terrae]HEX2889391.1 hypothetical protein [Vineibacter terrae]